MTRWKEQTLGEVLKVIRGVSYKKEQARARPAEGYLPIVRATNIQDRLTFDDLVYVPSSRVSPEQRLQKNDIVIAASSGSRSVVGKAAQLNEDWSGSFGAFCFGLRPDDSVNARFVGWFLQTREYRNRVSELAAGVNINNLRAKHIEETPIRLPPIDEQQRIVAEIEKQFTRLDAGVASLKRVQIALKRCRASVLKAACEGRLVPTEAELARKENRSYETGEQLLQRILKERREKWNGKGKYKEPAAPDTADLPTIPEGWTWATADQLTSVITDGEHITPERSESGILLLSARNVLDGRISVEDVDYVPQHEYDRIAKRLVIVPGDVLLSCSGSVGRSAVVPKGLLFTLVRSVAVLKPLAAMGKYLSLVLRSPLLKQQIVAKQTQTAQANIFQGKIKVLCLPLSPLAEQTRIVAEVERRLSVVEEFETMVLTNLRRATRLRQSILQNAFSPTGGER